MHGLDEGAPEGAQDGCGRVGQERGYRDRVLAWLELCWQWGMHVHMCSLEVTVVGCCGENRRKMEGHVQGAAASLCRALQRGVQQCPGSNCVVVAAAAARCAAANRRPSPE